jgi:hypothetical protein
VVGVGLSGDPGPWRILGGETARVPLSDLRAYRRNPRRGNLEAIKASLRRNGQYRPLIANRATMEVLVGNQTLRAMSGLGWREALVYFVDVDEEQAKRIVLVDNRTSDLAGYDTEELVDILRELGDLTGTGYEEDDLDRLLEEIAGELPVDDDEAPSAPVEPLTWPGDRVELGQHRPLTQNELRTSLNGVQARLARGTGAATCRRPTPLGGASDQRVIVDEAGRPARRPGQHLSSGARRSAPCADAPIWSCFRAHLTDISKGAELQEKCRTKGNDHPLVITRGAFAGGTRGRLRTGRRGCACRAQ